MNAVAPESARIGSSRPRREDERLVCGRGRFIDDLAPADALHIAFVRAAEGPATITAIDVSGIRSMPGIALVLSGAECATIGQMGVNPMLPGATIPSQLVLPVEFVAAPGQLLAAVIGESAVVARDAAEAIQPDLKRHEAESVQEVVDHRWQNGDVDAAFAAADHVVTAEISYAHLAPLPLEPRAALAQYDAAKDLLVLYLNTQTPHRARDEVARILGRNPASIRVIAPDIGGAFGMKSGIAPEDILVALASIRTGRPVCWTASRSDEFLSAPMGRGAKMRGSLALTKDGTILGLRSEGDFPLGGRLTFSALAPARNGGRMVSGPYRFSTLETRVRCHSTATAPVSIYRGAGRPEAVMIMERLMDEAAASLGMDRLAIRRKNLIPLRRFPFRMGTGVSVDIADGESLIRALDETIGLRDSARAISRRRRKGEIVGSGFALYVEPCGQGFESAKLSLLADGQFRLVSGSTAQGQGRETTFAEIAGDVLQVPAEAIAVISGDTGEIANAMGAFASRSTAIGGSAVLRVCEAMIGKAREVVGNETPIDWQRVARETAGITLDVRFDCPEETWASGLAYAELRITRETGEPVIERLVLVDDAGVLVNPLLAKGQLIGGIAQGVGEALMERMAWNDSGQLLTGSLMDYAVPRAADMPAVTLAAIETRSPRNPLGAKGVGEAGTVGMPAAILNAAVDALRPLGVKNLDMPLTSERLWQIIREGLSA